MSTEGDAAEAAALLELQQLMEVLGDRLNLCAMDVAFVSKHIQRLATLHNADDDDGPSIEPPPPHDDGDSTDAGGPIIERRFPLD